jgi:hypothetical protein
MDNTADLMTTDRLYPSEIGNTANKIIIQQKSMERVRQPYEQGWQNQTDLVYPRRYDIARNKQKGLRLGTQVYDGTPQGALNVWADGMQGFIVSPSLVWFMSVLDVAEIKDDDTVRKWLQEYDEQMYSAFRKANFYSILGEWFRDAGSVGTATLFTEEDLGNGKAVHTPIHPGEVYLAEDRYGQVSVIHRKFNLTARQAAEKFDEKKLLPETAKNAKEKPNTEYTFIHAVYPNNDKVFGSWNSKGKKWKSCYVQVEGAKLLSEGGFDINPYAVWRYRKNSDEIYGRSPAADAIVEILKINQIGKDMLEAGHMAVQPPMNIPEEMRGNVQIMPKGRNYFTDDKRVVSPVVTGVNFPIGIDREERSQKIIESHYNVDMFLMLARAEREMTAYEVAERKSEIAVLMGPQIDRLITEGLTRVFDIVSHIEDRAGRLPPVPDVLLEFGGAKIDIDFIGPFAQAQRRLFRIRPVSNAIAELAPLAEIKPEVLDRVNFPELAEYVLESHNFPQDLIHSDEEVEQIQKARAEQIRAQQMAEDLSNAADAVPKISKKPEEGSLMEALTNA